MTPSKRGWIVVVTVCLTLGIAACGSGAGTSQGNNSTNSTAATGTTGPAQNVSADKALAAAANLKLSDFPTGWTSNPNQNNVDSNDTKIDSQLASCLGTKVTLFQSKNDPASADSPEFDDSNGNTAQSSVDYRAAASQIQTIMGIIQSSKFPSCVTTALKTLISDEIEHPSKSSDTLPQGATIGTVTFAPMSFPRYGDQSSAFRVTIPISYKGLNFSGYFDLVFVEKGRVGVTMQFFGVETPFDPTMEQQLTSTVVGRLTGT